MSARALAVAVFVCSCANAGNPGTGGGGDDAPKIDAAVHHDASHIPTDTPPPIDAPGPDSSLPIDAMPDSGGTGGPFCTVNTDCTNAGECCFDFGQGMGGLCTPGTILANVCFPIT